jgi:two-component system, NarL family, response regulator NreC
VLVDDHKVMREGLRMVLDREANLEVVAEVGDGLAALEVTRALRPDVVVMDISMPGVNGLKATELLKTEIPATRVLILTRHADSSYVQQLLRSGASGYVLKQSGSEELVRAIRRVSAGHSYLDPGVTEQVVGSIAAGAPGGTSAAKSLSRREEDVLRFVALGFLTKEVASRLRISMKTVETHKANAMSKLGMCSRIDIVRYAVLHGWLQDA